jgi:sigma-B regulation protein RsbU (phosphoserine phosphatase)
MKMQQLTRQLLDVNRSLLEKQARLDEDLQAAVIIQQTLIPQEPPAVTELDIAWRFLPSDWVGGDVFHVFQLDEKNVGLYVADVSGHGVPAAMVTVFVSHSLSPQGDLLLERGNFINTRSARPPGEVLHWLDEEYPFERFHKHFTICYAVLDFTTGKLRYSSAGHPMPVLLRKDGEVEFLDRGGTIIGLGASMPFEEGTAKLQAGDRLFLYSDGVIDHSKMSGERYGEGRFIELLRATRTEPLEKVCERVVESLMEFGGRRAVRDDVTLLAAEFQPGMNSC